MNNVLLAKQDLEQHFTTRELELLAKYLKLPVISSHMRSMPEGTWGQDVPTKTDLVWLVAIKLHYNAIHFAEMPTEFVKLKLLSEGILAETWLVTTKDAKRNILKEFETFNPEIKILQELPAHDNIVKYINSWEADGKWFLLIEHVSDEDLWILMNKKPLSIQEIKKYGLQLVDALDHLHKNGIIHRDLKPENVMINDKGDAILIDFDRAAYLSDDSTDLVGTIEYLSPEVIKGEPQTSAVDVWQVGILLYEMMFKKPPFQGDDSIRTARAIMKGEYTIPESASPELKNLLEKILVRNPAERPSIQEIKEDPFFK